MNKHCPAGAANLGMDTTHCGAKAVKIERVRVYGSWTPA